MTDKQKDFIFPAMIIFGTTMLAISIITWIALIVYLIMGFVM